MAYEEQQAKRKVVVETPNSRREVTQTEAVRQPDGGGVSSTTVGIIVVVAVALVTILVLVLLSRQTSTNENLAAQQQPAPVPQTTIVQQPAPQQPPVIIQQPATQPAPVIVTPPAPAGGSTAGTTANGLDDATIQAEIDKKIADDPAYSSLGITATVLDGKVTLVGSVKSDATKQQIERMVRHIKGVKSIDNQIAVVAG